MNLNKKNITGKFTSLCGSHYKRKISARWLQTSCICMKDYIKLFTSEGTLITKQSISSVEEMLPGKEFARVHRSYIISLNNIKSFTAEVIEIGNTNIPIGKLYRSDAMKILQQA